MGIVRLVIIGLLVWVAWVLYRRFAQGKKVFPAKSSKQSAEIKTVRQCYVCGVHIPENEALQKGDRYFCSKAHLEQGKS